MLKRIITITTLISLCLLITLLNTTTPMANGPFGILAVFAFIYLSLFGLFAFFIFWMGYVLDYLSTVFMTRRPLNRPTFKHSCYYSGIISAAPVMTIGLQSVGAVGVYEVVLLVIFVIIGCLYVSKKVV